jgi:hypothetical protein
MVKMRGTNVFSAQGEPRYVYLVRALINFFIQSSSGSLYLLDLMHYLTYCVVTATRIILPYLLSISFINSKIRSMHADRNNIWLMLSLACNEPCCIVPPDDGAPEPLAQRQKPSAAAAAAVL